MSRQGIKDRTWFAVVENVGAWALLTLLQAFPCKCMCGANDRYETAAKSEKVKMLTNAICQSGKNIHACHACKSGEHFHESRQ